LEFMWATLKNEGDKDAIVDYLIEAKRLGLRIVLPHVNRSGVTYDIQSDDKGDFIRIGLGNVKGLSVTSAKKIIDYRPFSSYSDFRKVVDEKNNGVHSGMAKSLDLVGACVFDDNPRRGDEREYFFEYLKIPAFQTEDLAPVIKNQLTPVNEYVENECFVMMGQVRKIKTGPNWSRIDFVDETGTASAFKGSDDLEIESGQSYVFLIANNSIVKAALLDDLIKGEGREFKTFLEVARYADVPEGMAKVVSFCPRRTKAGKNMATVVFADEYKELTCALAFPTMFTKALVKCKEGAVVDVKLAETKDGTIFIDNVL
jgi:DNA polymerase III alpha subunit